MAIGGIKIIKSSPKSGLSVSADNISGLIVNGVATSALALGTIYTINGTFDAKALGLSDAYDKANGVLVYYHIREFYRRTKNKSGTTLYLMVIPQTVNLPTMVEDTGLLYSKKLINYAKGEIKQLGFAYNPLDTIATGGNILVTAIGADGDTAEVKITIGSKVLSLGTYTKVSGDTTVSLVAAGIRLAINNGTETHGFTGGGSGANVLITAPFGYGASINGGSVLSTSIVGTITKTITQFSGGACYAPTILTGNDADTLTAVVKAQALYDWAIENIMPCQMILEGKAFVPSSASKDMGLLACNKVTVVSGQDYDQADKFPNWNKSAALGTFLGDVAMREINENVGWTAVGNLTDAASGNWINPAFSNHTLIDDVKEIWDTLDNKKNIFPITYPLGEGIFWNSDHTCVTVQTDDQGNINESNIHYGRTADKAARSVYAALFTDIKSPQKVDPTTGKLSPGTILYFQGKCENRITLEMGGQISGMKVTVDPNSDLLIAKQLDASVTIVPDGSTDSIKVNIGLAKTI